MNACQVKQQGRYHSGEPDVNLDQQQQQQQQQVKQQTETLTDRCQLATCVCGCLWPLTPQRGTADAEIKTPLVGAQGYQWSTAHACGCLLQRGTADAEIKTLHPGGSSGLSKVLSFQACRE